MFEGAPATDERLLAYWRDRLTKVSPKDPLYDQYNNLVTQIDYRIAESKARTAYAQGKLTDQQMAQFYLDWSKKIPQDSEFYRQLQRDAAQFLERAKAGARAAGARASGEAQSRQDQATFNQYEAVGSILTDALTRMARQFGVLGAEEDFGDLNFQQRGGGPAVMVDLIAALNRSPEFLAQLKQYDPSFSGTVTLAYYQAAVQRQLDGMTVRYKRALAAGQKSVANDILKGMTAIADGMKASSMWDTADAYMNARSAFLRVWQDPTASPIEKKRAFDEYSKTLTGLANDPDNPVDDVVKAMLMAEATLDPDIDSWFENATGAKDLQPAQSGGKANGDIAQTKNDYDRYAEEILVASTPGSGYVWTYGSRNDRGEFTPGDGSDLGIVPQALVAQNDGKLIFVPQSGDADPLPVYVKPKPVTVTAKTADGADLVPSRPATTEGGDPVRTTGSAGQTIEYYVGGKAIRLYSFQTTETYIDANGNKTTATVTRWTPIAPWATGAKVIANKDGSVTIDVSGIVAANPAAQVGANGFTPGVAVSQTRVVAGTNSITDFVSPAMAAMVGAGAEGWKMLQTATENSPLRRTLEGDMLMALTDPTTGRLNVQAWNAFTTQLDTYTGQAPSQPVFTQPWGGGEITYPGVSPDLTLDPSSTLGGSPPAKTIADSQFGALYGLLAGTATAGGGVTIPQAGAGEAPTLKLPVINGIQTSAPVGPRSYFGQEDSMTTPYISPVFQPPAPISAEVFVPSVEYQPPVAPTIQYPTISWTSPSGTGAVEEEMPYVAPTPPPPSSDPLQNTDPNYWLGLGY